MPSVIIDIDETNQWSHWLRTENGDSIPHQR